MNLTAPPPPARPSRTQGGRRFSASGWVTPCIVAAICVALLTAAWENGRGNLHHITEVVNPDVTTPDLETFRPGGEDPIRLSRSATEIGRRPEFLSATLLPGRGMNIYQITALVPGRGEVSLLSSPPLADADTILSGQGADADGSGSTTLGGALLLPWDGRLSGRHTPKPGVLGATWNGEPLNFPASQSDDSFSTEGLLLNRRANEFKTSVLRDGQSAEAVFHAGSFSGSLPSTVDATVQVELAAETLTITVTASNTGRQPLPFGIGWKPLFAVPSGDRANALLKIPSDQVQEMNAKTGLPTGRILQIGGTALDLSRGSRLTAVLDQTYTDLQYSLVADGPVAELGDSAANIALRLVPATRNIIAMHVIAPAGKPWIAIEPDTNLDDPLGPEWGSSGDSGIVTLAPGASMQWKVRLEIALLNPPATPLF